MRVLICGSRYWDDPLPIATVVTRHVVTGRSTGVPATFIVGGAPGADTLAERSARRQGGEVEVYAADWDRLGKAAGPLRNQAMLTEGKPDVVWAFTDDLSKSKGTADMVRRAKKAGLPVYVVGRA